MPQKLKNIIVYLLVLSIALTLAPIASVKANAATKGTAKLTIFSTTDLHGQSITYSYDTASSHSSGSLAQISNIINKKKAAMPENGASLLVDCGDTVYGLGSKSIMNNTIAADEQYMYELMSYMGYDAITLGNHDFDYGYSYEYKALKASGLSSKVVLSNVTKADSDAYPWNTRKIIKKKIKFSNGKYKTVKIGITGASIPALSSYTYWRDTLKTHDIVKSVEKQVELLQDEGADIIVVLAHSGVGEETAQGTREENVGYQLTQIEGVDVLCLGHTHRNYPADNEYSSIAYGYDNVRSKTGFMNGVAVVQEADHGTALGITNLNLTLTSNNKVKVSSKSVSVREITSSDAQDKSIVALNNEFNEKYLALVEKSEAATEEGYNNYFGMFEDNALIQLVNDAKIAHAKKVIEEQAPQYSSYPIISSTSYNVAGADSASDYIKIDKEIKLKDILNLQEYSQQWSKFYYITGAQLKEMLEWQASAYMNTSSVKGNTWTDTAMNYLAQSGYVPILAPDWDNWKGLVIFDGVEYTIDTSQPARYDKEGKIINSSAHRISSLTCNGQTVSDSKIFVWVTKNFNENIYPPIGAEVKNQLIIGKTKMFEDVVEEYITEQSKDGTLEIYADDNWHLEFEEGANYVMKTSSDADELVFAKSWYVDKVLQKAGYSYYQMALGTEYEDTYGPNLVVSQAHSYTLGDPADIYVISSDYSTVSSVCYLEGVYGADDAKWSRAKNISSGCFTVSENGIYSVKATDKLGNSTIKYIAVDNIDTSVSTKPYVNEATNTDTSISGKASAYASIEVVTPRDVYTSKADESGYFETDVDYLFANDVIMVRQTDASGRISAYETITVGRSSANIAIINSVKNNQTSLKGTLDDSKYCKVVAVRGSKVYIPKGQIDNYISTTIYDAYSNKEIVETSYTFNNTTKKFTLKIPDLTTGETIKVYSYDWKNRASNVQKYTVIEGAQNKPKLRKVVAQEKKVYGRIPSQSVESCTIKVKDNNKTYTSKTNSKGYFSVKVSSLKVGDKIKVVAQDTTSSGKKRTSLTAKGTAVDGSEKLSKTAASRVKLNKVDSKDTKISGKLIAQTTDTVTLMINKKSIHPQIAEDGKFTVKLDKALSAGTLIAVLIRSSTGDIKSYNYEKVVLSKPEAPEFITKKINTFTKQIKVLCEDKATAVLKVGSKIYKAKGKKKSKNKYVYTFEVNNLKRGSKVVCYMKNSAGKSKTKVFGKVK